MKIKLIGDLSPEIPQVLLGKTIEPEKYQESNGACYFAYYNREYVVYPENYEIVGADTKTPMAAPDLEPITKANALWWVAVVAGDYRSGEDVKLRARAKLEEMIQLLLPE